MTDKEIRKLNRLELLELMVTISEENENLRKKMGTLQKQLDEREISLDSAGSIAEASLSLSGVFDAAQDAADRYLENIKEINRSAVKEAERMMADTKKECLEMEQEAKKQVDEKWKSLKKMLDDYIKTHDITKEELKTLVVEQKQAKAQNPGLN